MIERKIYYHDTDAGGVVYYGNYLKFLEEARTEFMNQKGVDITELHEKRNFYAVRKCSITYKAPARYGQTILCDAQPLKVTAAQIVFKQHVYEKSTKRLLVEAEVALVSLDASFKPTPICEELKKLIAT